MSAEYIVFGQHLYQPLRYLTHWQLRDLPRTKSSQQWDQIITEQCYIPQLENGNLAKSSFDMYQTLRWSLENQQLLTPDQLVNLNDLLGERGVGDAFLHVLLPDLTDQDKAILIHAGREQFYRDTNKYPQCFFAPEAGLNYSTLNVLAKAGYRIVVCAPEQVMTQNNSQYNCNPIMVNLGSDSIILLPSNRPISGALAFNDKSNADKFLDQNMAHQINSLENTIPLITWTDGETFGHHAKDGEKFLEYLLQTALPQKGVNSININDLYEVWQDSDYQSGQLNDRTAWSCSHGDLVRWHGACGCDGGHDGSWKQPFYAGLHILNSQLTQLMDYYLAQNQWPEILALNFSSYLYSPGNIDATQSLYSAKASSMAALTSCGTFFDNPHTSGDLNVGFVIQTLQHLIDANLVSEAQEYILLFREQLKLAINPHTHQSLELEFEPILSLLNF